jgi:hypothetical protein
MADLSNLPVVPGVPARGWTPGAKARFLEHLALKGNVRAACAHVGLSAEAAYRLRRRDPLFARGWDAALVLAHDHGEQVLAARAIDGVEEPVYYRGEQIGTRRKYDTRLLLAHLARLDRMAENRAAQHDAGRFDELLALLAGARCPEVLADADGLSLPRAEAIARAMAEAEQRLFFGDDGADDACDDSMAGDEADADEMDWSLEQMEDEVDSAACEAAGSEAAAQWDAWCVQVGAVVDRLAEDTAMPAGAAAGVEAEARERSDGPARRHPHAGENEVAEGRDDEGGWRTGRVTSPAIALPSGPASVPCTVSTVSTSALARIMAGPVRGFAAADHPAFHARKRR